jgi:UPF0716 protein FxsA
VEHSSHSIAADFDTMLARLILVFTLIPLIELYLLIEIGSRIGALTTIAVILATGLWGALLAREQGLGILREIQWALQRGQFPGDQIIEGAMILIGGAMLVTPGFLTDVLGILTLVPQTRRIFRRCLIRYLQRHMAPPYDHHFDA